MTRRLTSPAPSAHRVSHPLSGLIPPWPRGFVSRHCRPSAYLGSRPSELLPHEQARCLSAPRYSLVVDRVWTSPHQADFRVFLRPCVRHPRERCSHPAGRCSPGLSSTPRSTGGLVGQNALPSYASQPRQLPAIGVGAPGYRSEHTWVSLLERPTSMRFLHLVRPPG